MLNRLIKRTLFLVLLIPAVTAFSQNMPAGKWWNNPQASKKLNLTDDDQKKLNDQYIESRRQLIDLKSAVEKERFELENLLEKREINETEIMNQFRKLEDTRTGLAAERLRFIIQARKILGYDRFQTLKMLHKQRQSMRKIGRNMERRPAPNVKQPSQGKGLWN